MPVLVTRVSGRRRGRQVNGRRSSPAPAGVVINHFAVAHREMHKRPAREVEQRFGGGLALGAGVAVEAVLMTASCTDSVKSVLSSTVATGMPLRYSTRSMMSLCVVYGLAQHPQPVGRVLGLQVRVHRQRGPELRQLRGWRSPSIRCRAAAHRAYPARPVACAAGRAVASVAAP